MTGPQLTEIEEIKKLKARYFRFMDKKLWGDWGDVFTEDATLQFGPNAEDIWHGREQIVANNSSILANATTVHHGHMPEIAVQDAERATAIWAMEDIVQTPDYDLHGYGHYSDEYRRVDGKWRISHTRLTRLKLDVQPR